MAIIRNKFIFFDTEQKFINRSNLNEIPEGSIVFVYEEKENADDVAFIYTQGRRWDCNFSMNDIADGTERDDSTNTRVSVTTTNGVVTGVDVTDLYTANSSTNYLKNATSLKDADEKLDAQVKTNADNIAKNKIIDNDVVRVNTSSASGTPLSIAADGSTIIKVADGTSGLTKLVSGLKIAFNSTTKEIELQDTNNTKIGNGIAMSTILGSGVISGSSYDPDTGILTITFEGGTTYPIDLISLIDINDVSIKSNSQNYLGASMVMVPATENEDNGTQIQLEAKTKSLSSATSSSTGLADAYDAKNYVDSAITNGTIASVTGDNYVEANTNNRAVTLSTNVSTLVTDSSAHHITGAGANELVDASNLQTEINDLIDSLAVASNSVTSTTMTEAATSPGFLKLTYSETKGIVNISSISIKIGDLDTATEGLATVSDVIQYVSDITGGANQWKAGTGTDSAILKSSTSTASGSHTITGGTGNTNAGNNSIASGSNSAISSGISDSIAVGTSLETLNSGEAAFGIFNDSTTHATNASGQTVFSVGIGTSSAARSNGLEVRKNGNLYGQYGNPNATTPEYAYTNLTQKFYDEFEWWIEP